MPPRQRFTKGEVTTAALNLMRREGLAGVTARGLGAELGCSSRPIFTVFQNMDEVQRETIRAAREAYNSYVEKGLSAEYAFGGVGLQYFRFANEEPKLFESLFMTAGKDSTGFAETIHAIDDNSERILASVQETFGFSKEAAYKFYQTLWVFTHGLACLCVTGISRITEDEAIELMKTVRLSMLERMKNEEKGND